MSDRQDVTDIKLALSDPTRVLEALGMMGQGKARQRQAGGWIIRCPVHQDNSPSCSVQQRDGMLLWTCHACGERGDVLTLVAVANNLKLDHDFKRVLAEGARLAGLWYIVDKLEGREPREPRPAAPVRPPPPTEPPREWPPVAEVDVLWAACGRLAEDAEVSAYMLGRAIVPEIIDELDLARVLPSTGTLPKWASYRGGADFKRPWRDLGYRLILPMYDATGVMRSVRAWRVVDGEGPKRLPPGGHKASELVMVDSLGLAMLRGGSKAEDKPYRLVIVEGEPDFLSRASITVDAKCATLGIVNGSWTKAFAERVPRGCRVVVRTDVDKSGNRYAEEIEESLVRHAFVWRLQA